MYSFPTWPRQARIDYWAANRSSVATAFVQLAGLVPTHLWAGTRYDSVGGVRLNAVGAAVDNQPATGLKANAITSRFMDFKLADGTAWQAPYTALGDLAGPSWLFIVLFRSTDAANSFNNIIGKRSPLSPNTGWEMYIASGGAGVQARGDDGPTNYDTSLAINHNDGQWHVLVLKADYANNVWRLCSELGCGTTATVPTAATSTLFSIGTNRLATCGMELALVAQVRGTQVHGINGQTLATTLHNYLVE